MNEQQFNSLPLEQRKIAQQRLLDLGVYNGAADGKWGAGTKAAFELATKRSQEEAKAGEVAAERKRADDLRAKELEIESLKAEGNKGAVDAATAEQTARTKRKQEYDTQANSGVGIAAQIASNSAAPLGGYYVGRGIGSGLNWAADRSQASKNAVLQGAAEDRVAGLTTRDGARLGTERAGAMPASNSGVRAFGRMLPYGITGAAMLGKGGAILAGGGEDEPFWPSTVNHGVGLGMLGAGAGILEQGANYAQNPGVAPDARAIAIMESNQLRRTPPPGTPSAPSAPGALARGLADVTDAGGTRPAHPTSDAPDKPSAAAGTKAYMAAQAKELGIKGVSKLSKGELATRLAEAMAEHGGKRTVAKRLPKLPGGSGAAGLAGGLAYALTPDEAMAADGTARGGQSEALTNAGVAGGAAYGVSRLAEKLGPMVGGALGTGGAMATPFAAADAYDPTPTRLLQDRVQTGELARKLMPDSMASAVSPAPIEQAYQMAQIPERGDRSDAAMLARAQGDQTEAMPMPSASALEIPQGIPAPNPDGSSPYPVPVMGRLSRMQKHGATPEQIAHFLNQAVR
jgi:hypothetical protein